MDSEGFNVINDISEKEKLKNFYDVFKWLSTSTLRVFNNTEIITLINQISIRVHLNCCLPAMDSISET